MTTTGIFSGLEDGGLFNSLKGKATEPKDELSGIFDKAKKEDGPKQLVSTPRRVLVESGKRDMILSGGE